VLDAFNIVFLVHFTFPAVKFGGVFQAESHLRNLFIFLELQLVKELLFSLQVSGIELDGSGVLFEVRHGLGIVAKRNMKTFTNFRLGIRTGLHSLDDSLFQLVFLVMGDLLRVVLREVVDSGIGFVVPLLGYFRMCLVDLRERD